MNCIICDGVMFYYFSKLFHEFNLSNVDYFKCSKCGFVASKTHFEMKNEDWGKLNYDAHTHYNSSAYDPSNKPPPYFHQALFLHILRIHELILGKNWIDWGSGEGQLSFLLMKYFNIRIVNFDKYINPKYHPIIEKGKRFKKFYLVINSAVFEHVRNKETLNEINSYVSDEGSLAIHTLIRKDIPKDPKWMYLLPVHCAFYTNLSMSILMDAWGYSCSVYCVHAKMWVLFRGNTKRVKDKVVKINNELGYDYIYFKKGFLDYWP